MHALTAQGLTGTQCLTDVFLVLDSSPQEWLLVNACMCFCNSVLRDYIKEVGGEMVTP